MCSTRLAGNTGREKSPSHTTLLGCIFATKASIDNRKKIVNQLPPTHVLTIWWTSVH